MKKRALQKNNIREIFRSKARFLSILGIILLGVCFYGGIKATGPDMVNTADTYYSKKNLMDTKIISTLGLGEKDLDILKKDKNILDFEALYSKDVSLSKDNKVVRFFSYDLNKDKHLNEYRVTQGRLPKKSGEIALDSRVSSYKKYKIGDTFKFSEEDKVDDDFKTKTYTVVGLVNSPMYIENISRGNTNVGKGSIDYFAVIPKEDFDMKSYTEVYIRYKDTNKEISYSKEYDEKIASNKEKLKSDFKDRPEKRLIEIKEEADENIKDYKKDLRDGEKKLRESKIDLEKGKVELEKGKIELAQGKIKYNEEIKKGEAKLEVSSKEFQKGKEELESKEKELAEGKATLDKSKIEIDKVENELKAAGVDPNTNSYKVQEQIKEIKVFTKGLYSLVSDMTSTIESTPEGSAIPENKLNTWVSKLNNPLINLSKVQANIISLSNVSMNEATRKKANEIPEELSNVASESQTKARSLEELVFKLVPLYKGKEKYERGLNQYNQGLKEINKGKVRLANSEKALNEGKEKLQKSKIDGKNKLNESEEKLKKSEKELLDGEKKLKDETKKLEHGKRKLKNEEEKIKSLKEPTYYFFDREDNPGYAEFNENAERISAIATVFPVFFFMIAALVCLTTMTRMVDEKRGEIGTLKALGYTNWEISQKYIIYATTASLIGSLLGLLIGFNVFPAVIFNAYGSLYNLPSIIIKYHLSYSIQSIVVALICTLVSALVVLKVDLLSLPAILMRPKAPKAGQRILIEKITFIWNRLKFNEKVTARNLFRYKQRMLMTVLGIAGCMALIVTGFGLRDSIGDVVNIQFNKLWHYQGIVTYNKDAAEKDNEKYLEKLSKIPNYKDRLTISKESMKVKKEGVSTQDIMVEVPKTRENLDKFILFNDRKSGEKYKLTDNGAIINEKLAKMFKLKVGDTFEVSNNDNEKFPIKIDKIVENYAMHFVYLTPTYYEKVFNKKPDYNSDLILFKKDLTKTEENELSKELMEYKKVTNMSFLSKTSSAMNDSINSLNIVMWVLIISAGTLAFIVLYNLNNINISERIRELSTIKVLGFYDNEVTMYVYRENNILTLLGILLGCAVGKLFHGFVLETAEVDMLMFSPNIHITSYLYSALITILFSLIVMAVMHLKLYKVDMIEALKSNE